MVTAPVERSEAVERPVAEPRRAAGGQPTATSSTIIIVRPERPSCIVRPEPDSAETKLRRRPAAAQRRPRRQRVGPIASCTPRILNDLARYWAKARATSQFLRPKAWGARARSAESGLPILRVVDHASADCVNLSGRALKPRNGTLQTNTTSRSTSVGWSRSSWSIYAVIRGKS